MIKIKFKSNSAINFRTQRNIRNILRNIKKKNNNKLGKII